MSKEMIRCELEGPHACCVYIIIRILLLDNDECGRAQYNDESVYGKHDTRGSSDLRTLLQTVSLTRENPRCVRAA